MNDEGHSIARSNPTIERVLRDPAASFWLKKTLLSALTRDSVDAANTAEMLFRLIDGWRSRNPQFQTGQSRLARPLRRREQTKCASRKCVEVQLEKSSCGD